MTRRLSNWPAKLALFVEEKRNQPFAFAVNDCCIFTCDWLTICTGIDAAKGFRGYKDKLGAARVLKKHGGVEGIARKVAKANGWKSVPVAYAQRGDVVSVKSEGRVALGVCLGAQSIFPGPAAATFLPTGICRKAWRIG